MSEKFDFYQPCHFDQHRKAQFHERIRTQLKLLARELYFTERAVEISTDAGGFGSCGVTTMRSDDVTIEITQHFGGADRSIALHFSNRTVAYLSLCKIGRVEEMAREIRAHTDLAPAPAYGLGF